MLLFNLFHALQHGLLMKRENPFNIVLGTVFTFLHPPYLTRVLTAQINLSVLTVLPLTRKFMHTITA